MRISTLFGFAAAAMLCSCTASVSYRSTGWGYYGYGGYGGRSSGGYSTSYGSTNIEWNPPANQAPPPAAVQNDHPVEGSDGSFGWKRATTNADVEIHRVSESLARSCRIDKYGYDETQATCGPAKVFVRRDASDIYLLCAKGTDRKVCEQTWVAMLAVPTT